MNTVRTVVTPIVPLLGAAALVAFGGRGDRTRAATVPAPADTLCGFGTPDSRDPSWSPDGRRIVFSSNRSGKYEIWSMNTAGGDWRQLTHTGHHNFYPFYSPTGRQVAFTAYGDSGTMVAVVESGGEDLRYLTEAADNAGDPAWSPDGEHLVYVSSQGGDTDLWLMAKDGTAARKLFHLDGTETVPRFSPDGMRILFVSDREGNQEVYTAALDGSSLTNITRNPAFDGVPSWSPDGTRIAFYRRSLPSKDATAAERQASWATAEVYVVSAAGGPVRRLTDNGYPDQSPTWSPDGTTIAMASCRSARREVWLMDASGANARQLTVTPPSDETK